MPFARIQAMAKHGLLPRYLANVEPSVCASCTHGKATQRPWREKGTNNKRKLAAVTRPGGCISVGQLESPTPGFVGQIKGWLTTKRYWAATVFVDHFSGLTFIYLQFSTNAEETVNAKKAFEAYLALQGVSIIGIIMLTMANLLKRNGWRQWMHIGRNRRSHFVASERTIRMGLPKRRSAIYKKTRAP
jgi:hypothetical protein